MILADTSVWVHHLMAEDPVLNELLRTERILMHPFVIGELAVGNLSGRNGFLRRLSALTPTRIADNEEAFDLIEESKLYGLGIGWVDIHLLASTLFTPGARLWTRDKRLQAAAIKLGVSASPIQ